MNNKQLRQIEQGTRRTVLFPAEVLLQALVFGLDHRKSSATQGQNKPRRKKIEDKEMMDV